jgi:hypothetical protein
MPKHIRSKCFRINIQSQELEFLLSIIKMISELLYLLTVVEKFIST